MSDDAEYERMWSRVSPAIKTDQMADPDRSLTENEVVKIAGSGAVSVVVSDAYWVATESGPGAFRLTEAFRTFVLRKRGPLA